MPGHDPALTGVIKTAAAWITSIGPVAAVIDKRCSYRLGKTYPQIRLADLGPMNRTAAGDERRIQVEAWAEDYNTAEKLVADVVAYLPTARGTWAGTWCAGAEVAAGPFYSPDESSEKHRHLVDVGLLLYPSAP